MSNTTSLALLKNPADMAWLSSLTKQKTAIDAWFEKQFTQITPPIYSSVDLRFSGYKLTPIDTNLFPAGFNNLHPKDCCLAIKALQQKPLATKWLLIPENHTRNPAYWDNVATIAHLFRAAGCEMEVASLSPELEKAVTRIQTTKGELLVHKADQVLATTSAEILLLNNDLAEGIPPILEQASQKILPPLHMGWHKRRKIHHAKFYRELAIAFATEFDLDPWLISIAEIGVDQLDFQHSDSLKKLEQAALPLFEQIAAQYQQAKVEQAPFIVMKADAGTYGQAVMSIASPQDLLQLNRKQKQSMRFTKGKQAVNSVLLQEGVYTTEYLGEETHPAEPVIYLIRGQAVGGFYRSHTQQNDHDNLNKPGMQLTPFSLHELLEQPGSEAAIRCYAYITMARLATLAAAKEMQGNHP